MTIPITITAVIVGILVGYTIGFHIGFLRASNTAHDAVKKMLTKKQYDKLIRSMKDEIK